MTKTTSAVEQLTALKIKPGAKPGQIILGIDLSEVQYPLEVLDLVSRLGYLPELRYLELKSGFHVFAVLKQENQDKTQVFSDEYLMNEWRTLANQITPSTSVRLWRGYPSC